HRAAGLPGARRRGRGDAACGDRAAGDPPVHAHPHRDRRARVHRRPAGAVVKDTPQTSPLVQLDGIVVEFPGVRALDDVDFRLFSGEVHALMGENGAGKSTLIGVLTGTCRPSAGTVTVDGEERSFSGVAESRAAGIATVFQEAQLSPNLSVGENV